MILEGEMIMLKKINVFSIFALLLTLFLTGCSSSNSTSVKEESKTTSEAPEEKTEIIISAAASLTDVGEEIKKAFSEENPNITVTYNFGGSGNLAQQIQQGAPADIFLSASKKDMDTLSESDQIVEDSRFDFVSNELVIITEKTNDIKLPTLKDIANVDVNNIVMGDAEAVPAGRYGKESFENVGVWDKIESKLVFVSDISQVLTQVETGNAELGVAYNTDALRSEKVKIVSKIDDKLHAPIIYPAAIIKNSKNQDAANLYLAFLKSEEGKSILKSQGFITN